jgi:hypothetical protein
LNAFSTAIVYFESHRKLHRNVSYTNVLLREPGINSTKMEESRKQIIERLGLTDLETQRHKLKCREGLLVDFDYGGELMEQDKEEGKGSKGSEEDEEDEEESTIQHPTNNPEGNDSGVRTVYSFDLIYVPDSLINLLRVPLLSLQWSC